MRERGRALPVREVDLGAVRDENPRRLNLPALLRSEDSVPAARVTGVHIGSRLKQTAQRRDVSPLRLEDQRVTRGGGNNGHEPAPGPANGINS